VIVVWTAIRAAACATVYAAAKVPPGRSFERLTLRIRTCIGLQQPEAFGFARSLMGCEEIGKEWV
jgi:hypothetical protein